jgi:tRNA (cmo5U34)-methyltransferase
MLKPNKFVTLAGAQGVDRLFRDDGAGANWLDFAFDEQVVHVFPNMISRSVPGYWEVNQKTAVWARMYHQPNTTIYDLGASLGAASWGIAQLCSDKPRIVAVEQSNAMVEQLRQNLVVSREMIDHNIEVLEADVCDVFFDPASVVVCNYCIQFICPSKRQTLIQKIYDALVPGGVLLLAEKISMPDSDSDAKVRELHHQWKLEQGYTLTEVERKSRSIANVMPVDMVSTHRTRLKEVGFSTVVQWTQNFNFVGLLAIKRGPDVH